MFASLITVGVYGYTAETFLNALKSAGVDTLVDVRRRRSVRGRDYAFANSKRLQALLAAGGVRYRHALSLAPPNEIRSIQAAADESAHVARRKRISLSPAFVTAYTDTVLVRFDQDAFLALLPEDARSVALLCVEREPTACHRSLAADYLAAIYGASIVHLTP
jgi:uncharacterized protein (DUF488 family)